MKNAVKDLLKQTRGQILTTFVEDEAISANDEK